MVGIPAVYYLVKENNTPSEEIPVGFVKLVIPCVM